MPFISVLEEIAMEAGMEKGIEKGIEKGLLIGRIQMLEEMLGREAPARESLMAKRPAELQTVESALRSELSSR